MVELTRSRVGLILFAVAAGLLAFGKALLMVGYATISLTDPARSSGLFTAGLWVIFAGALAGFVGVGAVVWEFIVARHNHDLWEVAAAAVATLLIVLGNLVTATEVNGSSTQNGNVLSAVGIGAWAIVAVAVAAIRSTPDGHGQSRYPIASYWLAAAGGLVLIAVAYGLPSPTIGDATPGIVSQALVALGVAVLGSGLLAARSRGIITSPAFSIVGLALPLLCFASVASSVGIGIGFSSTATLTDIRVGFALPEAITAVAMLVFATAAMQRLSEVPPNYRLQPSPPRFPYGPPREPMSFGVPEAPMTRWPAPPPVPWKPSGGPPSPEGSTEPTATRTHCGTPLPDGALYCPRCGAQVRQ